MWGREKPQTLNKLNAPMGKRKIRRLQPFAQRLLLYPFRFAALSEYIIGRCNGFKIFTNLCGYVWRKEDLRALRYLIYEIKSCGL